MSNTPESNGRLFRLGLEPPLDIQVELLKRNPGRDASPDPSALGLAARPAPRALLGGCQLVDLDMARDEVHSDKLRVRPGECLRDWPQPESCTELV